MPPERIQGVLFDLGDTLMDYRHVDVPRMFKAGARLAYKHLLRSGQPLPSFGRYHFVKMITVRWNYLKSLVTGREFNSLHTLTHLNRRMDIHLSREETLQLAWLWYRPLSRAAILDPDSKPVLEQLRDAGLTVGLVSNTFVPGEILDRHLAQEGLRDLLPVRIYSCDVGFRKPDPRIFRVALERTGLAAEQTLFVGDSPKADVRGAHRAGMISVLKDPLDTHLRAKVAPRYRIRRLPELLEIIAQHNDE